MLEFVIQGVSKEEGKESTSKEMDEIAQEIRVFTSIGQPLPANWLLRPKVIREQANDSIIVSFPKKVELLGFRYMILFNRSCRVEKAIPDHRLTRCHRCQKIGHRQDKWEEPPKCRVCADDHITKTTNAPRKVAWAAKDAPIPLLHGVNCPTSNTTLHTSMDRSCIPCNRPNPSQQTVKQSRNSPCLNVVHLPNRHSEGTATELSYGKGLYPFSNTRHRHIKGCAIPPHSRTLANDLQPTTLCNKLQPIAPNRYDTPIYHIHTQRPQT